MEGQETFYKIKSMMGIARSIAQTEAPNQLTLLPIEE
jgi:hypothetical protein